MIRATWGATYKLPVRAGTRLFVPGDCHFPVHDLGAIEAFWTAADDWRCTDVVFQGDTLDGFGLSMYKKEAARFFESGRLFDETRAFAPTLERTIRMTRRRGGKTVYLPGNHDGERAEKFIASNHALEGHTYVSLFGLEKWERDVEFLTYGMTVSAGALNIEHGDKTPGAERGGANAALKVLEALPDQNTMFGHTHRVGSMFRETWKDGEARQHGVWNVGWLGLPEKQTYRGRRAGGWQLGGAFVEFYAVDGEDPSKLQFDVQLLRVVNRKLRANGRTYRC